uniref:EGF-like domain-containing protein n=1 Tax=Glossina brevipalpis TaxID=37001 RepID=A0A1A9W6S4_9MUSC
MKMLYGRLLNILLLCEVYLFVFVFHLAFTSANNVLTSNTGKNCTILEITFVPVKKTRIITAPVNYMFSKFFKKTATKIETYYEDEHVSKEMCCKGYKWQSETDLCEPVCTHNCPEHSKCVEPNFCECEKGYYSAMTKGEGKHYCEPICNEPCLDHSECIKPNECVCRKGYQMVDYAEIKSCEPVCEKDCPPRSECLAPNKCICELGYVMNTTDWLCQPNCNRCNCIDGRCECYCAAEDSSDFNYPDIAIEYSTESTIETDSTEFFSEEPIIQCSKDYVYYRGQCRPLKFSSIDCREEPCSDPNAICLENGTCECREGYRFLTSLQGIDSDRCVTLKDYELQLKLLNNDYNREHTIHTSYSWILLITAVVAVTVVFGSLIALLVKIIRKPRGQMNIEAKNLSCVYDNKSCIETPKTNI